MRPMVVLLASSFLVGQVSAGESPSYARQVRPIIAKYCLECHNTKSAKGGLDLETHKGLLEGSDSGPVVKLGKADESLLVLSVEGKGRNLMPPKSKTLRPTKTEVATLRAWINAGAKDDSKLIKVAIPDIKPKKATAPSVKALAYASEGTILAARHIRLERIVVNVDDRLPLFKIGSFEPLTSLAIDSERRMLAVATGLPGVSGRIDIVQFDKPTNKTGQVPAPEHKDLILDLAFSPNGKTLATCSYDTQVKLWDVASAKLLHTLKDHSDSVYGVSFHPDGNILATCGADRTVKLWNVQTGKLLFTFSESTDWNYAVAWRPGGKHLAAAGVDKSIRVWQINEQGGKIVHAVFAHEAPVLRLAYGKDGRTLYSLGEDRVLKAWDAERMVERKVYGPRPETVLCFAVRPDEKQIALGRYDGVVELLDTATGTLETAQLSQPTTPVVQASLQKPAPKTEPSKPEAKKITPAEARRGVPVRIAIEGSHLEHAAELLFAAPGVSSKILDKTATRLEAEIDFPMTTPAGPQQVQVKSAAGLSANLSLIIDPFPLVTAKAGIGSPGQAQTVSLPVSLVGKLDKAGDVDFVRFQVKQGQQVGVQMLTAAVGSKIEPTLQLTDLNGRVLAESNNGLLGYTFAEAGTYALGVRDREFRGGASMHYRLHLGEIPVVTALHPLGVQRGTDANVQVEGVFLAAKSVTVKVPADAAPGSKVPVPVKSSLGAPHGEMSIVVGEYPEVRSASPSLMPVPGTANGVLTQPGQRDEWRFHAKKGQRLVVEAQAQRLGAALDSVLEILDAAGKPVPRAVLRCQAKTFVTFRDHDNAAQGIRIDAWNDLAVNDYLYVGGELMKIKALPAHPDADCMFFSAAGGPRLAFLDTTPTHHSQHVPMYKVAVHPPGTTFPPNGFPVFPLYYRNDDGGPGYGRDSRIFFDPPTDDEYRVRVGDTRGQVGPNYGYRLTVRSPRPSFNVRFNPTSPVVSKEGAVPITIAVDRLDGYEGPIHLRFDNVPPGFSVPSTEIQAGETTTAVALYADASAQTPAKPQPLKLVAEAVIDGHKQVKEATGDTPKAAAVGEIVTFTDESEVTIRPGGEVKVQVHIERRGGFTGRVPLEVKGLPHGVRVLDIGLNGILITERETRRTIVLYAESWVEATQHPFVILARREGKNSEHAAKSVLLKVGEK